MTPTSFRQQSETDACIFNIGKVHLGLIPVLITILSSLAYLTGSGAAARPFHEPVTRPIIDSVEIKAENVFDLTDPKYNNFLFRLANRMHIVTRHSVVRRELLLEKGDVFDTALTNESVRNLRRLPYLLKTDIRLKQGNNRENILVVNTSDKWTTTGGVSLHRSGGRNDLQIGIEENNLLGYGIFLSNDYMILENDRDFYQVELADNRFLGRSFSLNVFYSNNPRAGQTAVSIGRPFYSLSQKLEMGLLYSTLKRRLDYYTAEVLTARDRFFKRSLKLQVSYRIGPNHIKYHFIQQYEYTDLNSRGIRDPAAAPSLPPPSEDSLIHYFQYTIRAQQVTFAVFERLNRFQKPEDINLGGDVRISYGRAYRSGPGGLWYQYYSLWHQYALAFNVNLIIMGIHLQGWSTADQRFHENLYFYFNGYSQYHRNHTLAIAVHFVSNHLKDQSNTLYLDEDHGLRGYPAFIFNGEDRLVMNIENRFFSDLEVLSVGIGGVVFADIGNIWTRWENPTLDGFHWAFGAGLRFGISRSTQGEVIRVDLAYSPDRKSWQISVGTGQFF